jgi:hypothetical protein
MQKTGDGQILRDETKTAAKAEWSEDDQQALDEENEAADTKGE